MKALTLFLFLTFNQTVDPILARDCFINEHISAEDKLEILSVVNLTINRYHESGNFWDLDLGQFDDEKYLEFIKLFGGSAEVVNDLAFNNEMLLYSDYAQQIFDNLQEIGVPFDLEDIVIDQIDIDEGGYYVVDLRFTKRLFSGLNQNGHPIKLKRGRSIKMNMRIDFPNYLIADARIQYIKMRTAKKVTDYIKQPVNFVLRGLKKNRS